MKIWCTTKTCFCNASRWLQFAVIISSHYTVTNVSSTEVMLVGGYNWLRRRPVKMGRWLLSLVESKLIMSKYSLNCEIVPEKLIYMSFV